MFTYKLNYVDNEKLKMLVGTNDENIKLLQDLYHADIVIRDNEIKLLTDDDSLFLSFKNHLDLLLNSKDIDYDLIKQTYRLMSNHEFDNTWKDEILAYTNSGKPIRAKTYNQRKLVKAIQKNDLTFAIGPAGTGKTYLAVLMAVKAYKDGDVKKIILTRPAVEAGESLGFLPGDLKEKVDPYLMPLYDSLFDILGQENTEKLIEKGNIEVIPLAYMRGRTLNEAFIILDEAQNTTSSQMLMFLTRLGNKSKMVVNGDITQIDLNISKSKSGLIDALDKLKNLDKIAFLEFGDEDIIRNPLVQLIIESYK